MPELVTRRTFLIAALGALAATHRPNHPGKPTPSPSPTAGLYSDVYAEVF